MRLVDSGGTTIKSCQKYWCLTLILLTWRIRWAPNNASKWQMGFNSAFKGLRWLTYIFSLTIPTVFQVFHECFWNMRYIILLQALPWPKQFTLYISIEMFSCPRRHDWSWIPPSEWRRLFLGIKRRGCEADHSTPSKPEVKNEWRYSSTSPYDFVAWARTSALTLILLTWRIGWAHNNTRI